MSKKQITDIRMLELIDYVCRKDGITQNEACEKIGYNHTNLAKIKAGNQSFKIQHLQAAGRLLRNINYNWLFGKDDNMTRAVPDDPIEALKIAVKSIEDSVRGR